MKALRQFIPEPLRKYGWLLIALIGLIIVTAVAWTPLRVLRLQARAGALIDAYIAEHASEYAHYFTCQIPALVDLPAENEGLAEALRLLSIAQSIRPDDPQTNLLLGRVGCLDGDYPQALNAFEAFTQARPDNPLGNLEAAFAHITLTLVGEDLTETERERHAEQARQILNELGVDSTYPVSQGNAAFEEGAYRIAWYWYRTGEIFGALSEHNAFRLALLDAINGQEKIIRAPLEDMTIFNLAEEALTIPPTAFFRLATGQPVDLYDDGKAAIYQTNRTAGGALIWVETPGQYCLSTEALDRPPEPTKIEMTHNLERLMMLDLPNGDNTWQLFETELFLEAGYHLIGFRLTNDFYQKIEDGVIDRNGYVGEVVIKRCD